MLHTQLCPNVAEYIVLKDRSVFWMAKPLTESKMLKSLISNETKGI